MEKSFRCKVCGYIHRGSEPPESCVVCGVGPDEFELIEETVEKKEEKKQWRCVVCGYIHEGNEPPEECPLCGVGKEYFELCEGSIKRSTSMEKTKIVIIGGGIAGLSAAEEIRNNSSEAEITMISGENHLPYYRVNLTKYLAGQSDRGSLEIYSESWYKERNINLVLGKRATRIISGENKVDLEDGSYINYDKLILANGAVPFIPPIPGKELKNVLGVRTIEDAEYILERIKAVDTCICIGGGILGLESAGAIAKSGVKVKLLEGAPWLMPRQLNKKASVILKKYLSDMGIEVMEGVNIKEIFGEETCEGVKLASGEVIKGSLVVVTAGVRPDITLSRESGLSTDKGLLVDNNMKTSEDNIFSAGDVTEHQGVLYGLWNAAQYQGRIAGMNALGIDSEFNGMPRSTVLKVLGLDMFSIGEFNLPDESYYQFEVEEENKYILFVLKDEKLIGSIIIGDTTLPAKVKTAVEKGMEFKRQDTNSVEDIISRL